MRHKYAVRNSRGNLVSLASRRNKRREASASMAREAKLNELMRREAELDVALRSPRGLQKIAANLTNPVKKKLDYMAKCRRFGIVEPIADGQPMIFDNDIEEFTAVKIGLQGTSRLVEPESIRNELKGFELVSRTKIPYRELYVRKFKMLARAKERLTEGFGIREDLLFLGLLADAASTSSQTVTIATALSRLGLARAFTQIENNRLSVQSVMVEPHGIQGIRRWEYSVLDQAGMQTVRETGWLGKLWEAEFVISDQVTDGKAYLLAPAEYLAWIPIRKDLDIQPADDPDNLLLGFTGYEFLDMLVHNALAVSELTFSTSS